MWRTIVLDEQTIKEINTCPPAKSKAEERYILKRKIKAFCNSLAFYICRIFPVDKKLVSVCTFEGKGGFGCNPKYIVMELHKQKPDVKFVWFVNKDIFDKKEFPEYIKKVPNTLWSRAYWLTRSKVWIDNYRKPYGTVKRKGQYYLNTWHGTAGFKSIGLWREDMFSKMAYLVSKNDSDMIDCISSDSKWCDEVFPKGLLYSGLFVRTGYPRCDILYGDKTEARKMFRNKYNLPKDVKLLMYAPTFREKSVDGKRSVENADIDIQIDRLLENIAEKFGGEWVLVNRLHPQVANQSQNKVAIKSNQKVVDASLDPDMYEILAAVDMVITDFSSVAFEAVFAELPVFMYATDISGYMNERGGQQWIFHEDTSLQVHNNREMMPNMNLTIPFLIAKNNNELEKCVFDFNELEYRKKIEQFKKELELVLDGKASERVAALISDNMR